MKHDTETAAVAPMTRDGILRLVASKPWFHRYKLVDDIITPGLYNVDAHLWVEQTFPGLNLSGKRVLEIGTWDGPYAFALGAKGAIVEAADIQDPDRTGFNVAKKVLNSDIPVHAYKRVQRREALSSRVVRLHSVLGVFYHLKYPVLALEGLARLLRDDGRLYFEGECLLNYASRADGRTPNWLERFTLKSLAHSQYPVSLYYSGKFKDDDSNWHVPNLACLNEWMKTAGLDIQSQTCLKAGRGTSKFPTQRVSGFAVKTGKTRFEHPFVEDIAADLEREKTAAAQRERRLTLRRAASRTLNTFLRPLGLKRSGARIVRAGRE